MIYSASHFMLALVCLFSAVNSETLFPVFFFIIAGTINYMIGATYHSKDLENAALKI